MHNAMLKALGRRKILTLYVGVSLLQLLFLYSETEEERDGQKTLIYWFLQASKHSEWIESETGERCEKVTS